MPGGPASNSVDNYSKFIAMFNNFFRKGTMSSTYKVIFLRSLADVGKYGDDNLIGKQWIHREGNRIKLDLDFIAARFAKYYWDMDVAFRMRHMPERMADPNDPNRDVRIIRLVREKAADLNRQQLINEVKRMSDDTITTPWKAGREAQSVLQSLNPPTLETLASDHMKEFREDVIKQSLKPEVLPHLKTDMQDLYENVPRHNYIILDYNIIQFMNEFFLIINRALNYMLATFLEKHNPSARHIATKIDNAVDFEHRLEQVRKLEVKVKYSPDKKPDAKITTDSATPTKIPKRVTKLPSIDASTAPFDAL